MGWNKIYILIMGSIRSFDGRNCEWLIKYPPRGGHIARFANPWAPRGHLVTPARCLVRMVRIPWLHRCQRILKLLRLNPAVVSLPTGSLVSLILSLKANISGDGHAKIASWRPCLFDCLRSFAKLEPRVGQ